MSGLYGILGDASLEEVAAMGCRLLHRGAAGREWKVSSTLHFGLRQRVAAEDSWRPLSIVLDGFVDNLQQLRELLGPTAAGIRDQAGLIYALYRLHGPDAFRLLRGQFGIALWDPARRALVLARDRWGARSIYYARYQGRVLFASEYKALLAVRDFPARPNLAAIQYTQSTYHAHPSACFLAGVEVVPASAWVAIKSADAPTTGGHFWEPEVALAHRTEAQHAYLVRRTLKDALREQTAGCASVGVALGGGLDSALVVAALTRVAGDKPIHTFTAGFDADDPEVERARGVAEHFGTTHHQILLSSTELPAVLRPMVWHMEDTVGREENAYLYVTARAAAQYVDTLFSGRKADMLFAGMPRHRLIRLAAMLPSVLRPALREFYDFTQTGQSPVSLLGRALAGAYWRGAAPPARVRGWAEPLPRESWPLHLAQPLNDKLRSDILGEPGTMTATERMHSAFGMHSNSPFMDYRMFEVAFSIPDQLKVRLAAGLALQTKYVLRAAGVGLLPRGVLFRGKSLQRLRHDGVLSEVLAFLADDLLSPAAVRSRGLFTVEHVDRVRRRRADRPYSALQVHRLWSLLLVELWARLFLDARGGPLPTAEGARPAAALTEP
jgi:asparagine synthase (glutamine-hydrolysing)